ncbi:type IV toxin-antitoxin system AbiEi family antitoxin domain-containing protein [Oerskovia flava]|uniref:type IV toxin-antitoxin system AbiEi family antitoxin domain-containing protein n=1 Tax=Oerskovia flava TaxID=2986422 RepID=UPI00223EB557|nr:type IV toxin-antitoxin system AbiEi family antitoxin domain-containing protein [Oerskovia sp. JB1-3-2]
MPPALETVASAQEGLVSTAQCRAAGVSADRLARLVRSGGWSRVTRGVYDSDLTRVRDRPWAHRHRRAAWAALLAFGPDAIAVGSCALALHGIQGLPRRVVPEAALPGAGRLVSRDGLRLRQFDDGMTVRRVARRLVVTPDWALAQAVPELDREHAVSVMDSALYQGAVTRSELDRAHDLARGRRGVARTHAWWELADARAESPLETRARLECVDHGLPPDQLQVPLPDADGTLRRGDMGWRLDEERWLIAEIDGAEVHDTPSALFADRTRQNSLVTSGRVHVLRFTARDLGGDGTVARSVRRTLRALAPR